jgi:internalin A
MHQDMLQFYMNEVAHKLALEKIKRTKNLNLKYVDLRGLKLTFLPKELLEITHINSLALSSNNLTDISLLKHFPNIKKLSLTHNQIEDISVLHNYHNLKYLFAANNKIESVEGLKGLKKLKKVVLNTNSIENISPLGETKSIVFLDLTFNKVKDFTPLKSLDKLAWLSLSENPINMKEAQFLRQEMPMLYFYRLDYVRSAVLCEIY